MTPNELIASLILGACAGTFFAIGVICFVGAALSARDERRGRR